MKKIEELRNLSSDELNAELLTLRKKQFELRMKKANGSLDKTHLVSQVRKAVARVKTIMTEKVGKSDVK
ncbi:50S ribosomal protein L29 [Legionella taurinensis]|uniref:Large ribosomal subunit protein uL29 n=2 Tax=Legionella TaxID=445 RepID=A0A0W0XMA8_9GAMM|nr:MULTISPECIES: 50S ribosomal protein L29 [Legionella]KTD45704.1 50S ribosomal protein L29 [Legionella rubrilucens]MDX1838443.1 50S ribosomal protein L29 [Legionella taurinensis]PUT38886.1 50S ribosomal protein L29 [Legionella taurinensis]PUT40946.1 50S ribosomal protein L29 [Legionella taurinensis]PUT43180.1 50S ribosomal protein L29 [Legionella taurinensis]